MKRKSYTRKAQFGSDWANAIIKLCDQSMQSLQSGSITLKTDEMSFFEGFKAAAILAAHGELPARR